MPHSVSPDARDAADEHAPAMADEPTANGASQATDGDVAMDEAEAPQASGDKKDVKLDELFADMDSDDEFPSSREPRSDLPASSSPESPPSPK